MTTSAPDPWGAIAQHFAAGVSINAIAKTFNVSRGRISRRAKVEGWTRDGASNGGADANRPAAAAAWGSAPRAGEGANLTEEPDPVAAMVRRHRAAWTDVYVLRDEAHRVLAGEASTVLGEVVFHGLEDRVKLATQLMAMFAKSVKALMMAQEGERRAYGVDYRQQQEAAVEDEAAARRRRELADSILRMIDDARRRTAASSQAEETGSVPDTMPHPPKGRSEPGAGQGSRGHS